MKTKSKTKKDYIQTVGRRKTSTARVRLYKGDKESTVNEIVIGKYFAGRVFAGAWQKPFTITNTLEKYFITAKVVGGGKNSQLGAVLHGTSRALSEENSDFRPLLKKEGLLTRDARARQRRQVGTGGRARRQKQSPKR
jgi:small subunit ribosomal protein S9